MASAAALYMASLTILGVLLGRIILKEEITWLATMALTICLCGISLVLFGLTKTITIEYEKAQYTSNLNATSDSVQTASQNQPPIFSQEIIKDTQHQTFQHSMLQNQRHIHTGTIMGLITGVSGCLFCGIAEAISIISLKYIQNDIKDVHILTFWTAISGLIFSTAATVLLELEEIDYPRDLEKSLFLVGHALAVATGQFVYVLAMEKTSAHLLSILLNGQIPTNMLFQYVIVVNFQPITGGFYDVLGALVVTFGLVLPPVVEVCRQNIRQHQSTLRTPLMNST